MTKLTTIKITSTAKCLEEAICKATGMPKAEFHRRAIDSFLEKGGKVEEDMKITAKTDPRYIKKEERDLIYLDDERREQLEKVLLREKTKITTVLFQAILDYCMEMCDTVPEDVMCSIIGNDKYKE